jgi:hypothetical protein
MDGLQYPRVLFMARAARVRESRPQGFFFLILPSF